MRKPGGTVDAHGRATLEIAADDERDAREFLHAVEEGSGSGRLGGLGDAVLDAVDEDESADVECLHFGGELLIGARADARVVAVERHDDQLSNLVVQGESAHPGAHLLLTGSRSGRRSAIGRRTVGCGSVGRWLGARAALCKSGKSESKQNDGDANRGHVPLGYAFSLGL